MKQNRITSFEAMKRIINGESVYMEFIKEFIKEFKLDDETKFIRVRTLHIKKDEEKEVVIDWENVDCIGLWNNYFIYVEEEVSNEKIK